MRIAAWVLALSVGLGPAGSAAAEAERTDLQVADVLARPGDPVELMAKLEKAGPVGTNVEGCRVAFQLDGSPVGSAETDARGVARLPLVAPAAGDHTVKAVFAGNPRWMRAEYLGVLAVRRPGDKLLAVAVDYTVAITDNLNTALGGSDCPPLPGAPEAMARLGRAYTIVWVTGRARQLRKRTVSWLHRYGFPPGPSFYLNPRDYPTWNVVEFKRSLLGDLKARFPGLRVAIGAGTEDLEAYRGAGLAPVLVGPKPLPGASCPATWDRVEAAVAEAEGAGGQGPR